MIRRVYLDFLREKLAAREFHWLLSRGMQYALVHASYILQRPLCGPILGTLVTNYTCNYHCSQCDLKLRDRELQAKGLTELDTARMKRVLEGFAKLGTPGIGFTGGEPLLRKDIFELLGHAKSLGMISHLNTNGYYLDERNIRSLFNARVDSLNISLDGACAETHDTIRGHHGAFERVVRAIGQINETRKRTHARLRIKTVAVLQERNIHEVEGMVRLAGELGVDCVEFIPHQPFTADADRPHAAGKDLLEQVDFAAAYLLAQRESAVRIENSRSHIQLFRRSFSNAASPLRCYAGYNSYAIDCYGEIYPCVPWYNWRRSAGNIRENEPAAFWYSPEYDRVRREVRACGNCYLNCQAELNIVFNLIGRKRQ